MTALKCTLSLCYGLGLLSLIMVIVPFVSATYAFEIPLFGITIRTLSILPFNNALYKIAEFPVRVIGIAFCDFVLFSGEGPVAVRPFYIVLFWGCIMVTCPQSMYQLL